MARDRGLSTGDIYASPPPAQPAKENEQIHSWAGWIGALLALVFMGCWAIIGVMMLLSLIGVTTFSNEAGGQVLRISFIALLLFIPFWLVDRAVGSVRNSQR